MAHRPCPLGLRAALFLVAAAVEMAGCNPPPTWSEPVSGLSPVLLGVWGTGPSDVWAVGGNEPSTTAGAATDASSATDGDGGAAASGAGTSLVMHYDGSAWTRMPVPGSSVLWWVFGFSASDVWMCGEGGTILHYDGNSFELKASGQDYTLFGIWGSSPTDLYAVGGVPDGGLSTLLHFDGTTFVKVNGAPDVGGASYFKVWGSSVSDVWFVGQQATMVHYDGTAYTKVVVPASTGITRGDPLFTVAGRASNDLYAVGGTSQGIAIHYDGKTWQNAPGLDLSEAQSLTGVFATPLGDVAITGLSNKYLLHSGLWQDFSLVNPQASLHATWLDNATDVFAVGGDTFDLVGGVVAHYGSPISSTIR